MFARVARVATVLAVLAAYLLAYLPVVSPTFIADCFLAQAPSNGRFLC